MMDVAGDVPATMANDALVFKLVYDLSEANCRLNGPGVVPEDEVVMSEAECAIQPRVLQHPPLADVQCVLGKGAQGEVLRIGKAYEGMDTAARKICVLTAEQIQEGGTMVGLQELVYAYKCAAGDVPDELRDAVVEFKGLYVQRVPDVKQYGVQVSPGGYTAGLLATMDMECMDCTLTQYTVDHLHVLPGVRQLHHGSTASLQYWKATGLQCRAFGTRVFQLTPMLMTLRKCLTGVKALQTAGLIHCDIKPDNVLFKLTPSAAISAIKYGDLGAACQQLIDGTTNDAKLATNAYVHYAKSCLRRANPSHSAIWFDITELMASMLQVLLGLCPDSLKTYLFNYALGDLATGRQTVQQLEASAAKNNSHAGAALKLNQCLQQLAKQQKQGSGIFVRLVRLILRVWYAPDFNYETEQYQLDELQAWDVPTILSELDAIESRMGADTHVVLDGQEFPLGPGHVDKLFSKLGPLQVLQLEQRQPGAWDAYHMSLTRHCQRQTRAHQMLQVERRVQQHRAAEHAKAQAEHAGQETAVEDATRQPTADSTTCVEHVCSTHAAPAESAGSPSCDNADDVVSIARMSPVSTVLTAQAAPMMASTSTEGYMPVANAIIVSSDNTVQSSCDDDTVNSTTVDSTTVGNNRELHGCETCGNSAVLDAHWMCASYHINSSSSSSSTLEVAAGDACLDDSSCFSSHALTGTTDLVTETAKAVNEPGDLSGFMIKVPAVFSAFDKHDVCSNDKDAQQWMVDAVHRDQLHGEPHMLHVRMCCMDASMLRDRRAASAPGTAPVCPVRAKRWSVAGVHPTDMMVKLNGSQPATLPSALEPSAFLELQHPGMSSASIATTGEGGAVYEHSYSSRGTCAGVNVGMRVMHICDTATGKSTSKTSSSPRMSCDAFIHGSALPCAFNIDVNVTCNVQPLCKDYTGFLDGTAQMYTSKSLHVTYDDDVTYAVWAATACEDEGKQGDVRDTAPKKTRKGCGKRMRAALEGACAAVGKKVKKFLQVFACGAPQLT